MRRFKGTWRPSVLLTVAARYTIALVAFVLSFFLRDLLDNWLTEISDRGLIVWLPAVLLVAFFLGLGPAILTGLLSAVAAWYFFLPPYYSFKLETDSSIALATFLVGNGVGIGLVIWLRTATTKAEALAHMLNSGFDAILVFDADDRITSWNCGATELYGWTQDEALGQMAPVLLQTKPPKPRDEILADVVRDGHWEGELVHKRKDGRIITVFSRWTPERDTQGQRASILETNMDVTERKQAEALIAADLRDMTRLNQLSNRLVRLSSEHDKNLNAVLDTAIAITGAVKGNIRLLDSTRGLLVAAVQRGFGERYLDLFESMPLEASVYAAAMKSGERVVIEDVRESQLLSGQPSKQVLLDAGISAVTSTPLMASTGNLLGMLSTHFDKSHRPTERELHLIDLLVRQTADYLERKRAQEIETTLAREVQHRSFNLLAIVQTIASRSFSGSQTLAEATKAFEARLQALARTNRQLTQSNWGGANLSEIVRLELQPLVDRTVIDGADITLSPQHAQNFGLALHELATNAAKYGALSNGAGKIGISWMIANESKSNKLKFKWQEKGGPPVVAPTRHGFGTSLLKSAFPEALIDYSGDGLTCEIEIPLSKGKSAQR